jgi:hypothetical protein
MWLFSKFHLLQLIVPDVYYAKTPISLLFWRKMSIKFKDCSESTAHVFDRRTTVEPTHFTITKISWVKMFKEIIAVYSENHTKLMTTEYSVANCYDRWDI